MNSIDMRNGFVRNLEWQAKKQVQLDAIYENERRRLMSPISYSTTTTSSTSSNSSASNNYNASRIAALEKRCEKIEKRLDKMEDMIVCNDDKLFVFAPESTVNAGVSLTLTNQQFRELVKKIVGK